MRIVQIEDFFHPEAGYQINIISKYMVQKGHEVFILCSPMDVMPPYLTDFFGIDNIQEKDEEFSRQTGIKVIRVPTYKYISGRSIFKPQIFRHVESLNPDILFVHGNDSLIGIQYIWRAKRLNFPLILDSHMLQMASKNKFNKIFYQFYRAFVTPRIVKNDLTIIRTQDDPYVKEALGIPLERCPWISVGSDLSLFKEDFDTRRLFRHQHNIPQEAFVILYLGKLDESKGGLFLANSIQKKMVGINGKEVVFMIVGNSAGYYAEEVEELLRHSQNKVVRFETQKYLDLPQFYQASDAVVFPKQCSLSFYDAQACGLPVIFENNDINILRSQHNNAITFISNDSNDFRAKMEWVINMESSDLDNMKINARQYVEETYNYEALTDRYLKLFEEEISKRL